MARNTRLTLFGAHTAAQARWVRLRNLHKKLQYWCKLIRATPRTSPSTVVPTAAAGVAFALVGQHSWKRLAVIVAGWVLTQLYLLWRRSRRVMVHLNPDQAELKRIFQTYFTKPLAKDLPDGSHPEGAFERTQFHNQAVNLVKDGFKRKCFIYDMCPADVRHMQRGDIRGNRMHYVDKDLQMPYVCAEPEEGEVCVLTDSDYLREDMPQIIAANPCVLYTKFPETTGGPCRNGRFWITADDKLHSSFHGGGDGDQAGGHPIWNWNRDAVSVPDRLGRTVVLIEMRRVSQHRFMVFSCPVAWVPHGFVTLLPDGESFETIPAPPFERMRYAVRLPKQLDNPALPRAVIALKSLDKDGRTMMSFSLPGEAYSVRIEREQYVALSMAYSLARKAGISMSLCDAPLRDLPAGEKTTAARTLHSVMLATAGHLLDPASVSGPNGKSGDLADIYPVLSGGDIPPNAPDDEASRARVVDEESTADTESPNPGRTIGRALIDRNVVQSNNRQLEQSIIDTRITPARAEKPEPNRATKRKYIALLDEFLDLEFAEHKHALSPLSLEETNELMNKPSQRADYDQVVDFLEHQFKAVSAFVKKETTSSPAKHPHLIQPVSKEMKVLFSRYTLAAAAVVKKRPWYAFGKSPADIAARVHEIAQTAFSLMITDYKKWDASLRAFIVELSVRKYKFFFHPDHHAEVEKLVRSQNFINMYLPLGTKCTTETMRLSGSPETSFGNTFFNAFSSYCAHRREWEPEFVELGIYGGDDGLNADLDPAALRAVAADLQLDLDVESSSPPDQPITLLAQTYINPAKGPGRVTGIRRCLAKLHLSTAPADVSVAEIIARKGVALEITDSQTPLLRELKDLLLRTAPAEAAKLRGRAKQGENLAEVLGYNVNEALRHQAEGTQSLYPPPDDEDEAFANVAASLEMDPMQLAAVITEIVGTDRWENLEWPQLVPPQWTAKYRTWLNGEMFEVGGGEADGHVVYAEKHTPTPSAKKDNTKDRELKAVQPTATAELKQGRGKHPRVRSPELEKQPGPKSMPRARKGIDPQAKHPRTTEKKYVRKG